MENILHSNEYWSLVEHGIPATKDVPLTKVQNKNIDEVSLKDSKGKNYLFQALECYHQETILKKDTIKDIWSP